MKKLVILPAILVALIAFGSGDTAAQTRRSVKPKTQSARVVITRNGYEPGSITLKRGIPARVTFLRTVENSCAAEVVFADFGIERALPLNQEVLITFTPRRSGGFAFTCGMNMYRGKLLVQ